MLASAHRTWASLATLALLALTPSCSATLQEGTITCHDGACPAGWSCWADRYCHASVEPARDAAQPVDAATSDAAAMDIDAAPSPDAAMIEDVGPPPVDGGPLPDAAPPPDASGPTLGLACTSSASCGPTEMCLGPAPGRRACLHSCASGMSCSPGESCVMGDMCITLFCSPLGERGSCPENFTCRTDPMGNPACFPVSWPP